MLINENSKFVMWYANSQSSHLALFKPTWLNKQRSGKLATGIWCLAFSGAMMFCHQSLLASSFCTTHPYINIHPPTQQVTSAVMRLRKIAVKVKTPYIRINKTMAFFLSRAFFKPEWGPWCFPEVSPGKYRNHNLEEKPTAFLSTL
jgi:hypothetical protein